MNKSFNTSTSKHYKASLAKRAGLVLLVFLGLASQSNSQSFDWGLYNAGDPGWISASVNKNGNFFFMGSANEGMDIDGFSFTGASQYVMMVNHSGHVEFLKKTSDDINSLVADNNDNFFMAFDMPFIAGNPFYIDDDTIHMKANQVRFCWPNSTGAANNYGMCSINRKPPDLQRMFSNRTAMRKR